MFSNLKLKMSYSTPKDKIGKELFIPLLSCSIVYKRSVGYFSSSVFEELYEGINSLARQKGHVKLITSPNLKKGDVEAIRRGYDAREIIEKRLLSSWEEPSGEKDLDHYNLLANLVAQKVLDLKIAYSISSGKVGLFHEKVAIFEDIDGEKVAINGSLNESRSAFVDNYETVDVYTSWDEYNRVSDKENKFDELWENRNEHAKVFDFPRALKEKILSYQRSEINFDMPLIEETEEIPSISPNIPTLPPGLKYREYQLEAIENFKNNNYRGIFDMATGTGKTLTGLGAMAECYKEKGRLAVIIVCPYQHLVSQWAEDVIRFNIRPIIAHSSSLQKDFKKKVEQSVGKFNRGFKDFFCMITTNATFNTKHIQNNLKKLTGEVLLIVDEAHNIGTKKQLENLTENFQYRLALSATLDRHNDDEGTQAIRNYFGEICLTFNLEQAISGGFLTEYKYFPIVVCLDGDEQYSYYSLSEQLVKEVRIHEGKSYLSEKGKRIAIKRARVVAGAKEKLERLKQVIKPYSRSNNLLVYCGATNVMFDSNEGFEQEERQIHLVTKMLGNDLKMRVAQYTSQETNEERYQITQSFKEGEHQVLVAIRCLDEGVDIPSIEKAFILASTTNPKEYIQRRGRVLRNHKGKLFAEIYDFVTTVRPMQEMKNSFYEESRFDIALIEKELERVREFSRLCMNPEESNDLIWELESIVQNNKERGVEIIE